MRTGQIGMEESATDMRRWAGAYERMAMALSEAGYPTRPEPFSSAVPGRLYELVFTGKFPPDEVLLRAADLCGIRDLMEQAEINGRRIG